MNLIVDREMKKVNKLTELRVCDRTLLAASVIILASGIQLEGWWLGMCFIWFHIAAGVTFFLLIGWHLKLHFGWREWLGRLRRQKSRATRWLAFFAALTLLSGIAATIHMFITWHHSALGGWHGKISYVFIAIIAFHTLKRIKFYSNKPL